MTGAVWISTYLLRKNRSSHSVKRSWTQKTRPSRIFLQKWTIGIFGWAEHIGSPSCFRLTRVRPVSAGTVDCCIRSMSQLLVPATTIEIRGLSVPTPPTLPDSVGTYKTANVYALCWYCKSLLKEPVSAPAWCIRPGSQKFCIENLYTDLPIAGGYTAHL